MALYWATAKGIETEQEAKAKLAALQSEIRHLRSRLSESRGQAAWLQGALQQSETRIGHLNKALLDLEAQHAPLLHRQGELTERKRTLNEALRVQRLALARQVRAAYATGRQEKWRLWLSQEDPSAIGRNLVYYEYLNRARTRPIERISETLASLRTVQEGLRDNAAKLEALQAQFSAEKGALEAMQQQRAATLSALDSAMRDDRRALNTLKADERELQAVIEALRHALADIPSETEHHRAFRILKGKLPWPTKGKITRRFGERRGVTGNNRWRGVLIGARRNQEIRAISHGRVVFADWMRAYGLLIIIDHSGGYMTLYGHNQSLYKSVGEWVARGDLIARAGESGGQHAPGLYFEIRYRGKPINPAAWCSLKAELVQSDSR